MLRPIRHLILAAVLTFAPLNAGALGSRATAQAPAGATVTGVVRERLADVPLPLATVSLEGSDRVVFTRGGGAFAIGGVSPGPHTLRVRQIGFAPTTVRVTVPDTGSVSVGVTRLERLATTLAAVEVRGQMSQCTGTGLPDPGVDSMAGVLLAQLSDQSDRLRAFGTTYPGEVRYSDTREALDGDGTVTSTRVDTVQSALVQMWPYQVGQVVSMRTESNLVIHLPSAAQLSSAAFVEHHCARYGGLRMVEGDTLYALELAPTGDVRSPDIAGTVLLTRSGVLRRTELRLAHPEYWRGKRLGTLSVVTAYRPILDGRVSVMDSFVAMQEVHASILAGHALRRNRQTSRTLAVHYSGVDPAADVAPAR
jgi:hypothetical protein